jgi:hypothetical protein
MVGRLLDLDDFLDPKSLTPQQLYKLQSETWAQGADYERERIIAIVQDYGSPDFTNELIALIKGEQPHPPQHFRDRSNGE